MIVHHSQIRPAVSSQKRGTFSWGGTFWPLRSGQIDEVETVGTLCAELCPDLPPASISDFFHEQFRCIFWVGKHKRNNSSFELVKTVFFAKKLVLRKDCWPFSVLEGNDLVWNP